MIEPDYVFPLLKSSDLGNGRTVVRRSVLVTQTHTGDDTTTIRKRAPKTWEYLEHHKDVLEGKNLPIYRGRPNFLCLELAHIRSPLGRSRSRAYTRIYPSWWYSPCR